MQNNDVNIENNVNMENNDVNIENNVNIQMKWEIRPLMVEQITNQDIRSSWP